MTNEFSLRLPRRRDYFAHEKYAKIAHPTESVRLRPTRECLDFLKAEPAIKSGTFIPILTIGTLNAIVLKVSEIV
jgi:hypothetical protein